MPIHTSAAVGVARDISSQPALVEAMEGLACSVPPRWPVPAVEVRAVSNELGETDRSRWDVPGALSELERSLPAMTSAVRS